MTRADLDRLTALEQQATKGPWFSYLACQSEKNGPTIQVRGGWLFSANGCRGTMADAELVAAMRNALPQLLKDAETLAQIRAVRARNYLISDFANEALEIIDSTNSSGHTTTKGER